MLKIILIILVFSICSLFGYIYGDGFRKRYIQLKESYKSLTLLQNEVIYNNTPLPEALTTVGRKANEPFDELLSKAAFNLREGIDGDVYGAFKVSYKPMEDEFYINKEDKSIFEDFLKSLGESGVYGQEKIFRLTLEDLKINIEEAGEISKRNTKLYRYLGICFGAMISIFLL